MHFAEDLEAAIAYDITEQKKIKRAARRDSEQILSPPTSAQTGLYEHPDHYNYSSHTTLYAGAIPPHSPHDQMRNPNTIAVPASRMPSASEVMPQPETYGGGTRPVLLRNVFPPQEVGPQLRSVAEDHHQAEDFHKCN